MLRTIRLGLISEGTNTWALYVARQEGFFEQEGLDVQVTVTGSSMEQQEALIDGRFDIGFQQPDHVVRAVENGADLFIFMAHGHAPDLTLVGAPDVRSVQDLRGRTIAVDGARTGYALLLRQYLSEAGLDLAGIEFAEVGGSQQRFDAMKAGAAAATLLNSPFDANLIDSGYSRIARMPELFPTYPGSVMAARRGWVAHNEAVLLAFMRAHDRAYGWLQDPSNHASALASLPARLAIAPRAARSALDEYSQRPKPQIQREGMQQVVDIVWAAGGHAQPKGPLEKYMDLSYLTRALAAPAGH